MSGGWREDAGDAGDAGNLLADSRLDINTGKPAVQCVVLFDRSGRSHYHRDRKYIFQAVEDVMCKTCAKHNPTKVEKKPAPKGTTKKK